MRGCTPHALGRGPHDVLERGGGLGDGRRCGGRRARSCGGEPVNGGGWKRHGQWMGGGAGCTEQLGEVVF